jgi:hypothetical protein
MDPAVKGIERLFRPQTDRDSNMTRVLVDPYWTGSMEDEQTLGVAVVRYHRALVLEKLGRHAEAKYDRARAKQLIGREPDETLF